MSATSPRSPQPRWKRLWMALSRSVRWRLMLVFLLLALAMAAAFVGGARQAHTLSWREAAQPLLKDYVDRLAADVTQGPDGATGSPSPARARAITERLPLTIDITGPVVNWRSHPQQERPEWMPVLPKDAALPAAGDGVGPGARQDTPDKSKAATQDPWDGDKDWMALLWRRTADGHWIEFGINEQAFERRTRLMALTLGSLLLFIGLAYVFVRRLLRPLDDISAGAQRFGAGAFNRPIAVRAPHRPDELGELAITINTMARDIEHMLDAKRALLLAISHELRSPLTRARLNVELLPDDEALRAPREALQRDLQEMARLITDLLESERLASRHAALHREAVDLGALVQGVLADLSQRHARASEVSTVMAADLPPLALDPARVRLLLRNLLDNALRHTPAEAAPPEVLVQWDSAGQRLSITVRDHGPGVPEQLLPQLAEPFFRPDSARTRSAGGVGLGLTLCRLVAQAHGGELVLSNAQPGLRARATLGV